MLFNSYVFIFLFLPIALLGWYGLNRIEKYSWAQAFLVAMSLWFYGYFHVNYLVIILVSCFLNYGCSLLALNPKWKKKVVLILGCVINLGILGYYKYYDFFLENINAIAGTDFLLKRILLPLGISFFTFQQLSYVIDRCTGKAEHYALLDYLSFVTFFPQLIAGPIVLHSELVPQFQKKEAHRFDAEMFADGICYFVVGLAKKVLLADLLAKPVDFAYQNYTGLDSITLFLGAVAYMFELYFDFSGYCDMAIGIGKMFGIQLPDNFNSPFKSASVKELWRRWHMTLGRFFTTYVYIPLGGSKKGTTRTIVNTMIVFALSGLWHGANWTFVIWGMLQGVGIVWDVVKPKIQILPERVGRVVHILLTDLYFCLSFVFFRSESVSSAWEYLKGIFAFRAFHSLGTMTHAMKTAELYVFEKALSLTKPGMIGMLYLLAFLFVMGLSCYIISCKNMKEIMARKKLTAGFGLGLAILFVWSVVSLSGVSTFLYFNF